MIEILEVRSARKFKHSRTMFHVHTTCMAFLVLTPVGLQWTDGWTLLGINSFHSRFSDNC